MANTAEPPSARAGKRIPARPFLGKPSDIKVIAVRLYFLPVRTRVPLKFGAETLTEVTCARVCARVQDRQGRIAEGWGETPLSVQWVWPSNQPYERRLRMLKELSIRLAKAWIGFNGQAHPLELGYDFLETVVPLQLSAVNESRGVDLEPVPWLAALVCASAFDLAIHEAFGQLLDRPTYATYVPEFMSRDLADFLTPAKGCPVKFQGRYPADFLIRRPPARLRAWHLVGGLDLLDRSELTGDEPNDGHPVLLEDWIARDGLKCLKIKLRGHDLEWDYQRLVRVGAISAALGVEWLSADFNCTVSNVDYVNEILDRLRDERPRIYGMILYVEQPFPYDLEKHRLDAHSVAARKPLFLDESAHDWRLIRLGRQLGWTGVALKTCKTQSGALLSACWAKAHGMSLMVQDLTNPMLAQIPHLLLAAQVGTIMGVETNAMQFYPDASIPEAEVHPGMYQRRLGCVDLSSAQGSGFGYRLREIKRTLPEPAAFFEI